jgi:hypothetical protein
MSLAVAAETDDGEIRVVVVLGVLVDVVDLDSPTLSADAAPPRAPIEDPILDIGGNLWPAHAL